MLPAPADLGFPAAAHVARITRQRTDNTTGKTTGNTTVETSYEVTSLPAGLADPAAIAKFLRGQR